MALSAFSAALNQICDEKGLPREIVVETVEAALAAAYRKDYGNSRQVVRAKLNEDDLGLTEMFQIFTVVKKDEFEDDQSQILLTDARKQQKGTKVGDEIVVALPHQENFGRIAAQTAKQVIIQRLREAERELLYQEFKGKEGTVVIADSQSKGRGRLGRMWESPSGAGIYLSIILKPKKVVSQLTLVAGVAVAEAINESFKFQGSIFKEVLNFKYQALSHLFSKQITD